MSVTSPLKLLVAIAFDVLNASEAFEVAVPPLLAEAAPRPLADARPRLLRLSPVDELESSRKCVLELLS